MSVQASALVARIDGPASMDRCVRLHHGRPVWVGFLRGGQSRHLSVVAHYHRAAAPTNRPRCSSVPWSLSRLLSYFDDDFSALVSTRAGEHFMRCNRVGQRKNTAHGYRQFLAFVQLR